MKREACSQSSTECCAVMVPRADISEGRDAVTVTIDLPGVEQSKLDVTFDRGVLSISAPRELRSDGTQKVRHQELNSGTFKRSFSLAEGLDTEKINASLRNGVLTLTIPRLHPNGLRKVQVH